MEQVQSPPFVKDIIEDIEETGEYFKQSLRELSEIGQRRIDAKTNSSKFEAIYGLSVSEKQRTKTMKDVSDVRSELWNDSLKKAKGNTKDAYAFYKKASSFD